MLDVTVTVCTRCANPEEETIDDALYEPGHHQESLTSQEAKKKDASIKESLLRSKNFLCPVLAELTGIHKQTENVT